VFSIRRALPYAIDLKGKAQCHQLRLKAFINNVAATPYELKIRTNKEAPTGRNPNPDGFETCGISSVFQNAFTKIKTFAVNYL